MIVIRALPPHAQWGYARAQPSWGPIHNPVADLTDKDGLDQAYSTDADLSTIKHTLYISGTKVNRPSGICDDITNVPKLWNDVPIINHYKSLMFGTKVLRELAKQEFLIYQQV